MPQFSKILCPVDFDQNSLAAVSVAAELARKDNATLYLLHVVNLPLTPEAAQAPGVAETAAETKLERIGHQKLKVETSYEILVMRGHPAIEALQMAARLGIDLIVMAMHGRKGHRRLVLGTVAERVVREAQCPVITVKPRAARAGASRTRVRPT
jgi:nucleotide-binding universal stress UspA family protein